MSCNLQEEFFAKAAGEILDEVVNTARLSDKHWWADDRPDIRIDWLTTKFIIRRHRTKRSRARRHAER